MTIRKFDEMTSREEVFDDPESPYISTTWICTGEDNVRIIQASLPGFVPAFKITVTGSILWRQTPVFRRLGYQVYEIDILYNLNRFFDGKTSFRTTGGTQKILGSLATVATSDGAPDFQQLIGVNADGTVEGTEIIVPVLEFTFEKTYPLGWVSDAMVNSWADLTGKTNIATFKGRGPRNWLYMGAEGEATFDAPARVAHFLAAQYDIVDATIAGLEGINKKGWEFLWFLVEDAADGGVPVKRAVHWYVEQIYLDGDFAGVLATIA